MRNFTHPLRRGWFALLLFCSVVGLRAQNFPVFDLCLQYGESFNTLADLPGATTVAAEFGCLRLSRDGTIEFSRNASPDRCCGETVRIEVIQNPDSSIPFEERFFEVTIKCKPNCNQVDLYDYLPAMPDPTGQDNPDKTTLPACEGAPITYYFDEVPGLTYCWQTPDPAAVITATGPGEIEVIWGTAGPTTLELCAKDVNLVCAEEYTWCIEKTPRPTASFAPLTDACLNQSVSFTAANAGGGVTYHWDFGDGNQATGQTVTHAFGTPGPSTVTLTVTSDGRNPDGSQSCCCTDQVSSVINIDPTEGPTIECISTLCAGDTSRYWTDATNCSAYNWSVSGNGSILAGAGTDTVTVAWGNGPVGTLTLDVAGCDVSYCPVPTSVQIPIISTSDVVTGPLEVCMGQTEAYQAPKWKTVSYDWSVPGATVVGNPDGHQAYITWPNVPGTYTVTVDYGSDFLAGLPGHDGADCTGTATQTVKVLGDFTIVGGDVACLGGTSFFGVLDLTDPGHTFNWTVDGQPGLGSAAASANHSIVWPAGGTYVVRAVSNDPGEYCFPEKTFTVTVHDPIEPTINGPLEYCAGETLIYSVASPVAGYTYNWSVTGGAVISGNNAPVAEIQFGAGAGAVVTLNATDGNGCPTDPVTLAVSTITLGGPYSISPGAACPNQQETYAISPAVHPLATYAWTVTPAAAGSIIAGNGTAAPTVQWNEYTGPATLSAVVELCGTQTTLATNFSLAPAATPLVTQTGKLCPGNSATLSIDPLLYASATWKNGQTGATIGTGLSTTITVEGDYVVEATELSGCIATGAYTAVSVDDPNFTISQTGPLRICLPDGSPDPVVFTVVTMPGNEISWTVDGVSTPFTVDDTDLTYTWTATAPTSLTVFATVRDPDGCEKTHDPYVLTADFCCKDYRFRAPYTGPHAFSVVGGGGPCGQHDVVADFDGGSIVSHGFALAQQRIGSITNTGGTVNQATGQVNLTEVGCYDVLSQLYDWAYRDDTTGFTIGVDPNGNPDTIYTIVLDSTLCVISSRTLTLCNPAVAEFGWSEDCGKITFTDLSTFDPAPTIVSYTYDFGDGTPPLTSPTGNLMHTYANNGSYPVTLTVDVGTCTTQYSDLVVVQDLPASDFTLSDTTVCAGDPVTFTATSTGNVLVDISWDFGDGALFTGNGPVHAYADNGAVTDYDVTLTTTNAAGCTDTVIRMITVYPGPTADSIQALNGTRLCPGEMTELVVVAAAPTDAYVWSTGETTPSIIVDTAGSYAVTLTNSFGCSKILDPVDVQFAPEPVVAVAGNPFICDFGSTELEALVSTGYTVIWTNTLTGAVDSVNNPYAVAADPLDPFTTFDIQLTIRDQVFGCMADTTIAILQKPSPTVNLSVFGSACAGDTTIIEVMTPQPGVDYEWSNGETGPIIAVTAAGSYSVVATDQITRCRTTGSATINPLPDLCGVPTGCYETCGPDTLHAPPGNYGYAWFQDGSLVGTDTLLVVDMSGVYQLNVTDLGTGCTDTSDPLELTVIDCSTPPDTTSQDCIRIVADTIVCGPDGTPVLTFEVCAGLDLEYSVGYLELLPANPAAGADLPFGITLSPALTPGDCRTVTVALSPLPPGTEWCYLPVGHTADPAVDPAALCCSDGDERCLTVPDCDPCDEIFLRTATVIDPDDVGGGCCYNLQLFNGEMTIDFDAIEIGVISGGGTLSTSATGAFPGGLSGLLDAGSNTVMVTNGADPIPQGGMSTPAICIDGGGPFHELEVRWISDGNVLCKQSITVFCAPDCGYLSQTKVDCNKNTYFVTTTLTNTSPYTMGSAYIDFSATPALAPYSTLINLPGGLVPGASTTINFNIGNPAAPNDSICFRVVLHELDDDGNHLNCCAFDACLETPDCSIADCDCQNLKSQVRTGISAVVSPADPFKYTLRPKFAFGHCDQVRWGYKRFGTNDPLIRFDTAYTTMLTLPGSGQWEIRLMVTRYPANVRSCTQRTSVVITIPATSAPNDPALKVALYPNPATEYVGVVESDTERLETVRVYELYDVNGKLARRYKISTGELHRSTNLDLSGLAPGVYLLRGTLNGETYVKRLVVQ